MQLEQQQPQKKTERPPAPEFKAVTKEDEKAYVVKKLAEAEGKMQAASDKYREELKVYSKKKEEIQKENDRLYEMKASGSLNWTAEEINQWGKDQLAGAEVFKRSSDEYKKIASETSREITKLEDELEKMEPGELPNRTAGCGAAVARLVWDQEAVGSIPTTPTN